MNPRCDALLVIVFGFVAPVVVVATGVIPFAFRFLVLVVMTGLVLVLVKVRGFRAAELGLRRDNLVPSFTVNAVATAVGIAILFIAAAAGRAHRMPVDEPWIFYVFYVIVSSTSQEFLYRGFLFGELRRAGITSGWMLTGVSAVLFAFLHVIYHDWPTVVMALGFGVVLGAIYTRTNNLWGVCLTHSVLGAASIAAGLV